MSFIQQRRSRYEGFGTRELVVAGGGPPIVLLHGFGDSADTWRQVLHLMHRAGRSAVAVDLPGFGAADPLAAGDVLPQLDAFAADLIRRHGRVNHVVVSGNSLGAALAARAARNQDLPIAAVLPLGVAGVTWNRLTSSVSTLAAVSRSMSAIPAPKSIHQGALRRVLSRLLYGARSAVDPQFIAQFAERIPDPKAARRLLGLGTQVIAELDQTGDHAGIEIPMTVIHGARDRLVPVSASSILHDANPGSRLVVLAHAGHCPQLDAADIVVRHALQLASTSTHTKEIS